MRKGIREMVASTLFGALDHQLAIKKEAAFRKRSKEDQAKILNEVSPGLCLAQPCAQPHPKTARLEPALILPRLTLPRWTCPSRSESVASSRVRCSARWRQYMRRPQ